MNRRDFFKVVAGSALLAASAPLMADAPEMDAPLTTDAPISGAPCKVVPFCRPQETQEDLEAEWDAWQAGVLDGHDEAVLAYKRQCYSSVRQSNHLARWVGRRDDKGEWIRGANGMITQTEPRYTDAEWGTIVESLDRRITGDLLAAGRV
jgi:hypothetical protein